MPRVQRLAPVDMISTLSYHAFCGCGHRDSSGIILYGLSAESIVFDLGGFSLF